MSSSINSNEEQGARVLSNRDLVKFFIGAAVFMALFFTVAYGIALVARENKKSTYEQRRD